GGGQRGNQWFPRYKYMIHLGPQPQSLCLRPHFAHSQYVHQIHFRWFSSSTISATQDAKTSVRLMRSASLRRAPDVNGPIGSFAASFVAIVAGEEYARALPGRHGRAGERPGTTGRTAQPDRDLARSAARGLG